MALFTIEQIELIRRLRNSGITKDQVLQAFNELERLDAEFGRSLSYDDPLRNHSLEFTYDNVSPGLPSNSTAGGVSNSNIPALTGGAVSGMTESCLQIPFKQNEFFGPQNITRTHCSSTNSSEGISESEVLNGDCSVHTADLSSKLQNELNVISVANDPVSNVPGTEQITQTPYSSSLNCTFFPVDVQAEELAELQELKKKGDMAVLTEIRNFVMAYNIKQTLIAEMTKMSQPYVSRFFRGDIQDMPDRTKNVFFMWYLTCKNNPLKLAQMCPNSGVKRMVSESGDLIPLKRERFTFKGAHLAVLERYYEQDPYPDTHIREMIVEECNKAAEKSGPEIPEMLSMSGAIHSSLSLVALSFAVLLLYHFLFYLIGGDPYVLPICLTPGIFFKSQEWPLSDKDTVTLPVVNNWFNNRRKDAKKQMRLKHGSSVIQSSCPATVRSTVLPVTCWSSCSVSTPSSFPIYQDLSSEITESDSSSASDRIIDSEQNLIIGLQDQESCDVKQIL